MNYARIEDLAVNPTLVLSPMVKKNLVDVVNEEFNSQSTIFNAEADVKREQILEQYKAGVGFTAMKKAYDKAVSDKEAAEKRVKEAEKKLHMKGLASDGIQYSAPHYYHHGDNSEKREIERACKKVQNLLDTVNDKGPDNIRNKIISRLWLANTAGEAMVILREVLGNGIIPSLTVKQLTQQ